MSLVPSGKRKRMQKQADFGGGFGLDMDSGIEIDDVTDNPIDKSEAPAAQLGGMDDLFQDQEVESVDEDILQYVMQIMTDKLGYEHRRALEFKDQLLSEKLLPGEAKEVNLVIPNKYNGQDKRLSDGDRKEIINTISTKFGLSFTGGEVKESKLYLNFSSSVPEEEGNEEDMIMGDDLDTIFGGGGDSSAKKKKEKKLASTQYEMMKTAKSNLFDNLLK